MSMEHIDVFGHPGILFKDRDNDVLSVSDAIFAPNSLLVGTTNIRDQDISVYLTLEEVNALHVFLTEWLMKKGYVAG